MIEIMILIILSPFAALALMISLIGVVGTIKGIFKSIFKDNKSEF